MLRFISFELVFIYFNILMNERNFQFLKINLKLLLKQKRKIINGATAATFDRAIFLNTVLPRQVLHCLASLMQSGSQLIDALFKHTFTIHILSRKTGRILANIWAHRPVGPPPIFDTRSLCLLLDKFLSFNGEKSSANQKEMTPS